MVKQEYILAPLKGIFTLRPALASDFQSKISEIDHDFEILEESKTHTKVKVRS